MVRIGKAIMVYGVDSYQCVCGAGGGGGGGVGGVWVEIFLTLGSESKMIK